VCIYIYRDMVILYATLIRLIHHDIFGSPTKRRRLFASGWVQPSDGHRTSLVGLIYLMVMLYNVYVKIIVNIQ
jgi:hypothetical protein